MWLLEVHAEVACRSNYDLGDTVILKLRERLLSKRSRLNKPNVEETLGGTMFTYASENSYIKKMR